MTYFLILTLFIKNLRKNWPNFIVINFEILKPNYLKIPWCILFPVAPYMMKACCYVLHVIIFHVNGLSYSLLCWYETSKWKMTE